jgi:hypothetical protein
MGYEQEFITARKAYRAKIKDIEPSWTLTTVIEEERPRMLV